MSNAVILAANHGPEFGQERALKAKSDSTYFVVRALWDDEAKVYVSESDIKGLHIEAETLEDFEAVIFEHARELIFENHI